MQKHPKIGISACFFHPDTKRESYSRKTLQFIEQSTAHWLMAGDALPVVIPAPTGRTARGKVGFGEYADWLDGLVLHGGADVWPGSYGEEPLHADWHGDRCRDEYEQALVRAFVARGKPVFGICRGLQLINVAFGGTLYQDIPTLYPNAGKHRDADKHDQHFHALEVVPNTRLAELIPPDAAHLINSIHHQCIKDLAPGFAVEARCPDDGMIEAIRHTGGSYVAAVQWHPEYHYQVPGVVDDSPLLHDFVAAARQGAMG